VTYAVTIFGGLMHFAGNCPDADADFDVNPAALRVDFAILDNPALVSFSQDGRYFTAPREISGGVFASIDFQVRKFRLRNKTAAVVARYDFTCYYDPIEVTGRDYVRPL
jgi:hypothetical protein